MIPNIIRLQERMTTVEEAIVKLVDLAEIVDSTLGRLEGTLLEVEGRLARVEENLQRLSTGYYEHGVSLAEITRDLSLTGGRLESSEQGEPER